MGKGEDLNEKFFAMTDERFLTQQKPGLLVDLLGLRVETTPTASMFAGVPTLAGGGTVVKELCYKSEGRWFDSRWCHWNFSLT